MKLKNLALLMTIVLISVLPMTAFANMFEGSYELLGSANVATVSADDTFEYSIFLTDKAADTLEISCDSGAWCIALEYDNSAFELVGTPVFGYNYSQNNQQSTAGENYYWSGQVSTGDATTTFTKTTPWVKYTFKVKSEASAGAKNFVLKNLAIFDAMDFAELNYGETTAGDLTVSLAPVTVEGDEEEEPAEEPITEIGTTFTTADNLTWEGIYTASYTKAFTGTKLSGSVELGYTKDGVAADAPKSVEISPLNGTFVNTEMTFTIAIVGVPSNVTINSVTPAIVAE